MLFWMVYSESGPCLPAWVSCSDPTHQMQTTSSSTFPLISFLHCGYTLA